ncbi:MAG: DUF1573 domain-containing protein, partial [Planctomycetota bacterium]
MLQLIGALVLVLAQEKAGSLKLEPDKVDFGQLERGARKTQNVKVANGGASTIRLMSIGETGRGVSVRVLDKDGNQLLDTDGKGPWNRILLAGAEITLEVSVEARAPTNSFRRKLILYTDEPALPKVPLVVTYTLLGDAPAVPAGEKRPAPRLKLDKEELQFGTLLSGEDPKIAVKLENVGDADLLIAKIQASCGCTEPTLVTQSRTVTAKQLDALTAKGTPIRLVPKETAALEAHLVSKGLLGEVLKEIMITSNDPMLPTRPIQVRAHLERGYKLEPGAFLFDKVKQGEAATRSVNVVADFAPTLEIIKLEPPDPSVHLSVTKLDLPQLVYRIDY